MVGDKPLAVLARNAKTSEKKRVSLKTEAEHKQRRKNDTKKDQAICNRKMEKILKTLVIMLEKK